MLRVSGLPSYCTVLDLALALIFSVPGCYCLFRWYLFLGVNPVIFISLYNSGIIFLEDLFLPSQEPWLIVLLCRCFIIHKKKLCQDLDFLYFPETKSKTLF